jgi:hypothetical protein
VFRLTAHPQDGLTITTLALLATRRRDVPLHVRAFDSRIMTTTLDALGAADIRVVPFGAWHTPRDDFRFTVLEDPTGRDDSGISLNTRGHRNLRMRVRADVLRHGQPVAHAPAVAREKRAPGGLEAERTGAVA